MLRALRRAGGGKGISVVDSYVKGEGEWGKLIGTYA